MAMYPQRIHKGRPSIARKSKIWGVPCELQVWPLMYLITVRCSSFFILWCIEGLLLHTQSTIMISRGCIPFQVVQEETHGDGIGRICEMSGSPDQVNSQFSLLRKGGRVVLVGLPKKPLYVPNVLPDVGKFDVVTEPFSCGIGITQRTSPHIQWNENVILTKFSLLAALEVVILTTFSAASDENFIRMTLPSHCNGSRTQAAYILYHSLHIWYQITLLRALSFINRVLWFTQPIMPGGAETLV